jgi:hypothetical protein
VTAKRCISYDLVTTVDNTAETCLVSDGLLPDLFEENDTALNASTLTVSPLLDANVDALDPDWYVLDVPANTQVEFSVGGGATVTAVRNGVELDSGSTLHALNGTTGAQDIHVRIQSETCATYDISWTTETCAVDDVNEPNDAMEEAVVPPATASTPFPPGTLTVTGGRGAFGGDDFWDMGTVADRSSIFVETSFHVNGSINDLDMDLYHGVTGELLVGALGGASIDDTAEDVSWVNTTGQPVPVVARVFIWNQTDCSAAVDYSLQSVVIP